MLDLTLHDHLLKKLWLFMTSLKHYFS